MSDIIRLAVFNSQTDIKQYRGFYIKEAVKRVDDTGRMHLTFSNDEVDISASGYNEDSAYVRVFNQIDNYLQEIDRKLSI